VPHLLGKPKSAENMELLQISVVGVIVHGFGNFAFHYNRRFAHDSSLVAWLILSVLQLVLAAKGRLPRRLFIQMDNCVRENKNRNVLGLLAALLLADWFDEVCDMLFP